MPMPDSVNQCWSVDFACDQLASGRRFRVCNIVDHFSRECVVQITDFSISGERLVRELDQLARTRSLPGTIVLDNGPELTSKAMFFCSKRPGVKLHFIQPGKPTQNAFVESFNGKFRDTCLNQHWFLDLADARQTIDAFRAHYNDIRPHSSLNYQPRPCSPGRQPDMILFPQRNWADYGGKVTGCNLTLVNGNEFPELFTNRPERRG